MEIPDGRKYYTDSTSLSRVSPAALLLADCESDYGLLPQSSCKRHGHSIHFTCETLRKKRHRCTSNHIAGR